MGRLLPVERVAHELDDALPCGERHQPPVQGREQRVLRQAELAALDRAGDVEVEEDEVADEEHQRREIEDERREHRLDEVRAGEEEHRRQQPEDRVQEEDERAADDELKGHEALQARLAHEQQRVAHVDEVGLDVALDPARALADPVLDVRVGLLERRRVDHRRPVARLVQADAEVGVLGDVVRVPGAELAQARGDEVVGGAAQRDRRAVGVQARQQQLEPHRVLGREPARQQVLIGVVVVELRLHAGDRGVGLREGDDDLLELVGVGPVLGVEDHRDVAARQHQAVVAGLGLRLRLRMGHDDEPEVRRQVHLLDREDRLLVVLLAEQQHVELRPGVVQPFEAADQRRQDGGLLVQRHEDRVDGQAALVEGVDLLLGRVDLVGMAERLVDEPELVERRREVEDARQSDKHDRRRAGIEHEPDDDDQQEADQKALLRTRQDLVGAVLRQADLEILDGEAQVVGAVRRLEDLLDLADRRQERDDLEVGVEPQRPQVVGTQGVCDRDIERRLVGGHRRDAQRARDLLGNRPDSLGMHLATGEVQRRHLQLLGQHADEVRLADDAGVQQHVAQARPRAPLLGERRLDLLGARRPGGDE